MKAVVAHCGARDGYQVAAALAEQNLLGALVTDLYWPADRRWTEGFERLFAGAGARLRSLRYQDLLPSRKVEQCPMSGTLALALRKSKLPFFLKRWAMRTADVNVGRRAGRLASQHEYALLSYSYYGHSAFSSADPGIPRILFQLHPHPLSVRRILARELELFPECATSLLKEWELALPEPDFQRLVEETHMAEQWIVASSFTRATLLEHGLPAERIHVTPYGVNLEQFHPGSGSVARVDGPMKLLFVGTFTQRKGIRYLLDAIRRLNTKQIELTVCGRVVDDLSLFKRYDGYLRIRPSVSLVDLLAEYRASDLFVFPSLAEGFGHVLLEAMACGVPVLSTARTAAVDLIDDGREGFIVEPGSADVLAERIEWSLLHRRDLVAMGQVARAKAETFTWARFRQRVRDIYERISTGKSAILPAEVSQSV
jgi:glycosyltransferase involved in cell wall biosynthesis